MNPFILLLVSHILGDGIFTSSRLARDKREPGLSYQILAIGRHTGIHALLAGLLLFMTGRSWLNATLLVFALHFLIDFIRCRIEIRLFGAKRLFLTRSEVMVWIFRKNKDDLNIDRSKLWPWLALNILDQGAHLTSLYVISLVV